MPIGEHIFKPSVSGGEIAEDGKGNDCPEDAMCSDFKRQERVHLFEENSRVTPEDRCKYADDPSGNILIWHLTLMNKN